MAQEALNRGARGVVIADLTLTEDAKSWQLGQSTASVLFIKCDVTKWRELESLSRLSMLHFDDVPDIWIPAAGVFEPVCDLLPLLLEI